VYVGAFSHVHTRREIGLLKAPSGGEVKRWSHLRYANRQATSRNDADTSLQLRNGPESSEEARRREEHQTCLVGIFCSRRERVAKTRESKIC